jgi:TPR repeat protein
MLIRRGDEKFQLLGDISAARLLYGRAAAAGDGQAAIAMGRTYDPAFLAGARAVGIESAPAVAEAWYRRALALGAGEARELLFQLGVGLGQDE